MLQTIRDRFTGLIAGTIIAVIAVALTITLVDTDTFTGAANFAARVNGEDIPVADFRQVAQQQVLEQEQLTRAEIGPDVRRQLEQNVLEGMVRNRVVAQYVQSEGYRVGDQRVAEHIRSLPAFQVGGSFSSDGYMAALASQGVTPAAFEEERRAALQIEELQNGLLESSFFTPAEFRRFVVLEGERRRVSYAVLDPKPLLAGIEVTDTDLKSYYDAHPEQFESEESVVLEYVEVNAADLPPAVEPTEEDLRTAYESNPERFRTAEQRRARHILVAIDQDTNEAAALERASELKSRLDAGEKFEVLAQKYSDDTGSAAGGGDLGWAGQGTYVDAFEQVLFAQQVGELSQPVKTEFGYHLIQLTEIRPGAGRSFDEVRGELSDEARGRSAQDAFFALTEKMDDAALENPTGLDAVAAAAARPIQRVERFTRAGGGPFAGNRAVIESAFSGPVLEGGENSSLIEIDEGRAIVLRVAEHRPVRLRPLEEVRSEVESAFRLERAASTAAKRGQEILDGAKAGADFAGLVAEREAVVQGPQQIARNSTEVPPALLNAVFRANRPAGGEAVYDGVALADGAFAVFRVEEVVPARPEDIPQEQRDARKRLLARQSGIADVTALAVDLRNAASVVVAPGLFEEEDNL